MRKSAWLCGFAISKVGAIDRVPMRKMLRLSSTDLHAIVSRRVRGEADSDMAAVEAPRVPVTPCGSGEACGVAGGNVEAAQGARVKANQHTSPWTSESVTFLIENYPKHGKKWCADALGMLEHQIRGKASALGLKARGLSDAWHKKQKEHADKLRGRKRPEQADVMRRLHETGAFARSEDQNKAVGERTKKWIEENGHPRGMAGKKHNAEAREKMSVSGKNRFKNESEEIKASRLMKGLKTKAANGTLVNPRPQASWKAGWREVGGQRCYFRSAWEANYARYLQFLLEKDQIAKWEHEPETFWFESIKRGCRSYLPDFRVTERNGEKVFHEVKGWMDARSKTKINRMRIYHPAVKLIVIDAKAYSVIKKSVSSLIHGWEA